MTCREVAEFLVDYVASELRPDVKEPFERHLSNCPNCREFLKQYRETIAAGAALAEIETLAPPDELVDAILASLRRT